MMSCDFSLVATESKLGPGRASCARPVAHTPPGCRGRAACAQKHGRLWLPGFGGTIPHAPWTKADKAKVQPDCAESGSLWRAANVDSRDSQAAAPARQNRLRLSASHTRR